MSLTERVQSLQRQVPINSFDESNSVETLRQAIKEYLSMDAVAAMMRENPDRARNEIRKAAQRVFTATRWEDVPISEQNRLTEELIDQIFGMGPIESLLADPSITEIMVNGSQSIFFERDGKLHRSTASFENDEQVRLLIDRIISPLGRRIDEASPMVNGRLPQGHRVHAIIPPLALDGPILTIRAFSRHVMTLEEMLSQGSLDRWVAQFLVWIICARKNIAVSGGTGSGKTTLLNALSCYIPEDERIITIEDSAELKFEHHPHVVRLEARPKNAEGLGEVTIRDLVINALRMRPDRIIVGECRGGEALDMLQAMNTGHDGSLTTLHANSVQEVVERLVTMVRYGVDLPLDAIEAQIGDGLDFIISIGRNRDGSRTIKEIAMIGFDGEVRRCFIEPIYERPGLEPGLWISIPHETLLSITEKGIATSEEVMSWKSTLPLRSSH